MIYEGDRVLSFCGPGYRRSDENWNHIIMTYGPVGGGTGYGMRLKNTTEDTSYFSYDFVNKHPQWFIVVESGGLLGVFII
jgi:hypothetical protein